MVPRRFSLNVIQLYGDLTPTLVGYIHHSGWFKIQVAGYETQKNRGPPGSPHPQLVHHVVSPNLLQIIIPFPVHAKPPLHGPNIVI